MKELMSLAEVAEMLGIKPESVTRYLTGGRFPEPDKRFGRYPAWYKSTIRDWQKTRPGKGRRSEKDQVST